MRAALATVPGVQKIEVDYENELATVKYDAAKADPQALISALKKKGYKSWQSSTETKKQ